MVKPLSRKKVYKLQSISAPIHPAVDVAAIMYSLSPGYRIPVAYLRGGKLFVEAIYKYRDVEITRTRSIMVLGPKDYVDKKLAGYTMVVSTEHSLNEELTKLMTEAGKVIDSFPYLFVVLGQIVPHASLAIFMEKHKDWMPNVYSIRLEPIVREAGNVGYHGVLKLVDGERDKKVEEAQRMFIGVVAGHDVTSLIIIANAPRLVEIVPSRIKEYVEIKWGTSHMEEEKEEEYVEEEKLGEENSASAEKKE
ncbi:MAG: hypothetical protein GXO43_04250 [Crenarchaeota archaeon]|nr:hypothetical protein [Thermoproteota archaeon]